VSPLKNSPSLTLELPFNGLYQAKLPLPPGFTVVVVVVVVGSGVGSGVGADVGAAVGD
jgi:hypothetical protein